MKISPSDSSNSEVSTFLYTAALVCLPTVINIVANRVLKSLSSEETASKCTRYITAIPLCLLLGYDLGVFFAGLGVLIVFKLMTIPATPRNSHGFVIWNPQMSCVIADQFIGKIEKDDFIPYGELYREPKLDTPEGIEILDRFAHHPYDPEAHDPLIKEIAKRQPGDAGASITSILQRLNTPLLESISPTAGVADVNELAELTNIKEAIEKLEPYRLSLLRKVISHLHFVTTKSERYHMTSDRLAQVFEPLLFDKLPQPQAKIALLKRFIENPALYSLDKISTA